MNLEDTKLGDLNAIKILEYAKDSHSLMVLNLSKNSLSDKITEHAVEAVNKNTYMTELYLHWNSLTEVFATDFFDGIKENSNLRVLDVSWNSMGKGLKVIQESKYFPKKKRRGDKVYDAGESIKMFLWANKHLYHLDLSSNNFRIAECEKIAEGLAENRSVYGFHFEGNYGYVDVEGFLNLTNAKKDTQGYHSHKRIDSVKPLKFYNRLNITDITNTPDIRNCCWICDGWHEITFKFPKPYSGENPIYIHFRHEGYKPVYMPKVVFKEVVDGDEVEQEEHVVTVMVPPTKIFFFFTVNYDAYVSEELPIIHLVETDPIVIPISFLILRQ